jgi:anti-sigma B factor antagonist
MIQTTVVKGVVIASFVEVSRFNALISEQVKEELKSLYTSPGTKLIIDLEGIQFIDSSGFGVFLSLMRAANSRKGKLRLCNARNEVMQLFKVLQLHHVLEIYNTLDEAINSFSK